MYYIYHIPNYEINISTRPESLIKKLGFTEYEILEKHSLIDTAKARLDAIKKEIFIDKKVKIKKKTKYNFVYELINSSGKVEYVGETANPGERWINHIYKKAGKFYNRTDIKMNIVPNIFLKRVDAYRHQCKLQIKYGITPDNLNKNR